MSGSLWNCACQKWTGNVCLLKAHSAQGLQSMKMLLSPSLCSGWAELDQAVLPKSSLRFPVLSIILIHTARKHLLSIPYHTKEAADEAVIPLTDFYANERNLSPAPAITWCLWCAQTTKPRLLKSRRLFLKGSKDLNLYSLISGH